MWPGWWVKVMTDKILPLENRTRHAGQTGLSEARDPTGAAAPETPAGKAPAPELRTAASKVTGHNVTAPNVIAPNVIAMPVAAVRVPPVIGDVMAYWGSLRAAAGGDIPARAAVDPKAIGPHLGQVFIAALTTPRVARLRIVGAGIADLMGLDPRGMALCALFTQPAREDLREAFAQVATGARVILPLQSEPLSGQPRLSAVMALMPLRGADGAVNQILGVIGVNGNPGAFARKLGLAAPRIIGGAAGAPAAPPPRPEPAMSEPATSEPAPLLPDRATATRATVRLRLVPPATPPALPADTGATGDMARAPQTTAGSSADSAAGSVIAAAAPARPPHLTLIHGGRD